MTSTLTLPALLRALAPHQPTIAGTYPLGLQTEQSDIDVLCTCQDLIGFEAELRGLLPAADQAVWRPATDPPSVAARVRIDGLDIEVFCQALPVWEQNGFRHMVLEGRLLTLAGAAFRERVVELKRAGVKTEPAFAEALGLTGDPFASLLEGSAEDDAALVARLEAAGWPSAAG